MKALLADNDTNITKYLRKYLEKEGFVVETTQNGHDAFSKIKQTQYNVVILDILLPAKSGFEVIGGLRCMGNKTPIIVLSSRSMTKDKVYALNLGADDYMQKTTAPDEVLARIKAVMRRSNNIKTNLLRCGDISLNLSNMNVQRGNQHIPLSKKEKSILYTLLIRKKQIVPREDLILSAWKQEALSVHANTLDSHIRSLRKKLSLPNDMKSKIRTFRFQGYQLLP